MQTRNSLDVLVQHYESCLEKHGDGCKAVDWPNEKDANKRYEVMLGVCREILNQVAILDYGCGVGGFLKRLFKIGNMPIDYTGYDASSKMIAAAKLKHPYDTFTDSFGLVSLAEYDYVIMNGLFTVKSSLSFDEMWRLMREELLKVWPLAKRGIAFNVMSCNVDWKRDDLFHCPMDMLTEFITDKLSKNFVIRNDYGLREYTVYVYREGAGGNE